MPMRFRPAALASALVLAVAGLAPASRAQTVISAPIFAINGSQIYSTGLVINNGANVTASFASVNASGTSIDSGLLTLDINTFWSAGSTLTVGAGGTMIVNPSSSAIATTTNLYGAMSVSGTLTTGQINRQDVGGIFGLDGGTLVANTTQAAFLNGFSGNSLVLGTNGGVINSAGFNIGIPGAISGAGRLTKTGAGTLTLSGLNTFTGGLTVSGGTLSVASSDAFIGGPVSVAASSHLNLQSAGVGIETLTGSGTVTFQNLISLGGGHSSSTFAGVLTGAGRFVKTGIGNFVMAGQNTYTGNTTVAGGTLTLGVATALPTGGDVAVDLGATLDLGSFNATLRSLTGNGTVNLSGRTLTLGGTAATATFAGTLGGSGIIGKTGTGTLTLTNNNYGLVGFSVNGGTLAFTQNSALADLQLVSGAVDFGGGTFTAGTFDYTAGTVGNGSLTVAGAAFIRGNLALASGSSLNFTASTPLSVQRSGQLLSLTVNGGTHGSSALQIGDTAANQGSLVLQSGSWTTTGDTAVGRAGTGTLTLNGGVFSTGTLSLAKAGGTATLNLNGGTLETGGIERSTNVAIPNGTVVFNGGTLRATADNPAFLANFTAGHTNLTANGLTVDTQGYSIGLPSNLGGVGGLTKIGSGTLTLLTSQFYTGGTLIAAGTLVYGNGAALNSGLVNNATFAIDRTDNLSFGAISGTGSVVKNGTGTLTFNAANTYTGGTTVNAGTLVVAAANAIAHPAGTLAVAGSGTFQLASGTAAAEKVTLGLAGGSGTLLLDGGTLTTTTIERWSGPSTATFNGGTLRATANHAAFLNGFTAGSAVLAAGGLTLDTQSFSVGTASELSGSGHLTKTGTGTLTLAGANTFTGTLNISAGTVRLGDGGTAGSVTAAAIANEGTLQIDRADATTLASVISGTGTLQKNGAGTLTLTGNNTYSGLTTLNAGTLEAGSSGAFSGNSTVSVGSGAILSTGGFAPTVGALTGSGQVALGTGTLSTGANHASTTFAGSFSGTGGLTKVGTGTFTLQATGLAGPLQVSAGALTLAADVSAAPVTVATGATLDGTGSVGSLAGTGSVAPGSGGFSVGALGTSTTFAGTFGGTGALAKVGAGTLTLSGTGTLAGGANAQFGTLAFSGANLSLGSALRLGLGGTGSASITNSTLTLPTLERWSVSSGLTLTGATLRATGNHSAFINGFNDNSAVIGSGGLTIDSNGYSLSFSANTALAGTGGLTKTGTGTLTLSSAHTYTGTTTVAGGTLVLDSARATGAFTLAGGTLDLGGFTQNFTTLTLAGGSFANGTVATDTLGLASGSLTTALSASTRANVTGAFTLAAGGSVTAPSVDIGVNSGTTGSLTVAGGSLTTPGTIAAGSTGTGTLTISSGAVSADKLLLGFGGGTGTLNLTGGTLTLAALERWSVPSTASFDGGTLRAAANASAWLAGFTAGSAVIGTNGLGIDTNGFAVATPAEFSGVGGLIKSGAGTLALTGASTFTGPITISAGTLVLEPGANLTLAGTLGGTGTLGKAGASTLTLTGASVAAGALNLTGGTLALTGANATFGALAGTGALTLNGTQFTTGASGTNTSFAGTISGNGNFTKTGAGTLTISGANSLGGTTTIADGTLSLVDGASISGAIANNATLAVDRTTDLTLAGNFTGSGALTKSGGSTLTLAASNVSAGLVTVANGSLALTGSTASFAGLAGSGAVNAGTAALTIGTGNVSSTFTGSLTGNGSLTKIGTGTFTLSSPVNLPGGAALNGGSLALSGATATLGSLAGTGNLALTGTALDVGSDHSSRTFSGVVSGTGSLVKSGTGTLTLGNTATFAGGANVATGTLALSAGAHLNVGSANLNLANSGAASFSLAGGAALTANRVVLGHDGGTATASFGAGTATVGSIERWSVPSTVSFNGTTLRAAAASDLLAGFDPGSVTIGASGLTVDTNGFNASLSSSFSSPGNFTKTGAGTLTLTGTATLTGSATPIIGNGTLAVGTGGTLAVPGIFNVTAPGSFNVAGGTVTSLEGRIGYATGTTGEVNVSAGSWQSSQLQVGNLGHGTLRVTGGLATTGEIYLGTSGQNGTGTLILDGGVLAASGISRYHSDSNLYGNGGTLRATGPRIEYFTNFNVATMIPLAGSGLTFDTNGFEVGTAARFTGAGGLTKTGAGTLTLVGAQSFTGPLTISGGTVYIPTSDFSFGGPIVNHATLVVDRSFTSTLTLAGNLSGTGTLVKDGNATLVLSGTGITPGNVVVNRGMLSVSGATASFGTLGGTGNGIVNVEGGATLAVGAGNASSSFGGRISGSGVLEKTGSGTLTLSNSSAFEPSFSAGSLLVSGGTLAISGQAFSQNVGALTMAGGHLALSAGVIPFASLGGHGTIGVAGTELKIGTGNTASTFSGVVSGTGGLTKVGTGTLTLSGANSHTGATVVTAGTLAFGAAQNLGSIVVSGGNLDLGGLSHTAATVILAGGNLGHGTLQTPSIDANGGVTTISSGSLTSTGALFIGRNSGGNGSINLTGGTVSADKAHLGQDGGAGILALAGGSLATTEIARWSLASSISFNGGTLRAAGDAPAILNGFTAGSAVLNAGGLTVDTNGFTVATAAEFTGTGGLTKTGLGLLTLTGANTYSGTTQVLAGTLRLGAANALSPNTTLFVSPGATFDPNGFAPAFGSLSGTGTIDTGTGGLNIAPSALNTFSGTLTGSGGLTMSGSGTLELASANSFTGATTISSGTLRLGAAGALPSGTPLTLSSGATLNLNGHAATLGSLSGAGSVALGSATLAVAQSSNSTFSGALSGTGGLAKSGSGTLTLSGTHTFTGATAINAGRLHLTGSATASAFSVAAGAILSGTGSLGALTVASGGTVSPGASPGTLSAGNTVFSPGGSLTWEINNATGVSGTHYDLLAITGTLDVAATSASRFTINLVSLLPDNSPGAVINFNSAQNYSYTFATTTAGIVGFAPTDFTVNTAPFTNALAGGSWSVAQAGNNLTLNFTAASAIPEPSTYAAFLGLAALALAAHRRRR